MALPPPQSSSPTAPSPGRSASPRPRWIVPAALVVAGVVLGVVVGAIAFRGGGSSEADTPEDGAADAALGCELLTRLPDEIPERPNRDDGWGLDGPYIWRLQAVSGAFVAAAAQDRAYRAPGEAAERLWRGYQTFSLEDANEALATLRTWCTDDAAD